MLSLYLAMVETEEERNLISKLYTRYEQKMYSVAFGILHNKYNAEDAVHEAFIRIIKKISELTFDNDKKTEALFVIIVKNIAIDMYNKEKRAETVEYIEDITEDESAADVYERLDEITAAEAIKKLPEALRQIIVMRYILGLDVKVIASVLHISMNTVYARTIRARKALYRILEENNEGIK